MNCVNRARIGCLITGAFSLTASNGSAQPTQIDPIGCYDLELGDWVPGGGMGADSLLYAPPPRVLLDSGQAGPEWPRVDRRLLAAPGSLPSVHRLAAWTVLNPDSVRLAWSTGSAGVILRLATGGRQLRGFAETFTSAVGAPIFVADARATAISCDAPVTPVPVRPIPDRVEWEGPPLVLGDTVVPSLVDGSDAPLEVLDSMRLRLVEPPLGWFVDAVEVHVLLGGERTIAGLWLRYDSLASYDALVSRFSEEMGTPTQRETAVVGNDIRHTTTAWMSRRTWFMLVRQENASGETLISVFLRDPRL